MRKMFIDNLSRQIELSHPPQRIISLCPSITDTLYSLKLDDRISAITKFCPPLKNRTITTIGGTKNVNIDKIKKIQPDLIIAEKEENTRKIIEKLSKDFPVYVFDIESYEDALNMIDKIGQLCGCHDESFSLIQRIEENFAKFKKPDKELSSIYFIWQNPYMVAGKNTFINAMMKKTGFRNAAIVLEGRYPKVTIDELKDLDPQVILLSSEPFSYQSQHIIEYQKLFPGSRVFLVDGKAFGWYGRAMEKSPEYISKIWLKI